MSVGVIVLIGAAIGAGIRTGDIPGILTLTGAIVLTGPTVGDIMTTTGITRTTITTMIIGMVTTVADIILAETAVWATMWPACVTATARQVR